MICEKYEAELKEIVYPSRKGIRAEVFKGFEDFVGTQAQIDEERSARDARVNELFRERLGKYRADCQAVVRRFKDHLFRQEGTSVQSINERIYKYAEIEADGSLADIERIFLDLVPLLETAYNLGKQGVE